MHPPRPPHLEARPPAHGARRLPLAGDDDLAVEAIDVRRRVVRNLGELRRELNVVSTHQRTLAGAERDALDAYEKLARHHHEKRQLWREQIERRRSIASQAWAAPIGQPHRAGGLAIGTARRVRSNWGIFFFTAHVQNHPNYTEPWGYLQWHAVGR